MSFKAAAVVCLLVLFAGEARAQQAVRLEFKDGRVTLHAQNAPVRAILAEWARLGGATIVNGDRVTGAPVTLELVAVPERQALDTILRSVAAYMLAPRRAGTTGVSMFDRILILPTSNPPRVAAQPTPGPGARPLLPRPPVTLQAPPPGFAQPGVVADAPEENTDDEPVTPIAVAGPGLGPQPASMPPQPAILRGPAAVNPAIQLPSADEPPTQPVVTGAPGTVPSTGNPFGVPAGSSSRPGVIAPAPQQPQQNPRQ